MTTTLQPSYAGAASITCTTTSLATDANLLAGRQSTVIDNTTNKYVTAFVGGTIATTGTPTANTQIEVYAFGSWDNGTTYSNGLGASDANATIVSGQKNQLSLLTVITQPDTTPRTYTIGPIDIRAAMGLEFLPDHWGIFVVHNIGTNLGATALKYNGIADQFN